MRVGIVGAGTMGSVHAESHREAGHEVVAIYDPRPEAAAAVAAPVGARAVGSFEELLADPAIEVIDVCVPTYLHRAYVEAAARASKQVICEKPLALTLEDGRAMIEACRQAGVQLFVGHVVRFFSEFILAKRLVEEGKVGRPGLVRMSRGGPFPRGWDNWYADPRRSAPLLLDLVIHDFDWLRWT